MRRSILLPSVLLFLLILWFHTRLAWDGDDMWFLQQPFTFEYYSYRYMHWSSRTIVEGLHAVFLKYLGLQAWRGADAVVMWLCCRLLVWFACPKEHQSFGMWCMIPLAFLFPVYILHTAGWGASTFNYLWPGTALLVALLPLKQFSDHRSEWQPSCSQKAAMAATLPVLLIALNVEQSMMIFGAIWLFSLWQLRFHRAARWMLGLQGVLLAASAIFILRAPGNALRSSTSVFTFWQDFPATSFLDKCVLSLNNMGMFFLTHEIMMLFFTALLAWLVWQRRQDPFFRAVGLMPFLLKWGAFAYAVKTAWPKLMLLHPHEGAGAREIFDTLGLPLAHIVTPLSYMRLASYVPLFASVFFFVSILLALYVLYGPTRRAFCWISVYVLGCASAFVLAFSPTLFASSYRIFFFQYLAMMGVFLTCLDTWRENRSWCDDGKADDL